MEKLILKVGDRVMVRSDLGAEHNEDIPYGLNYHMTRYAGQLVTIDCAMSNVYYRGGVGHKMMEYSIVDDGHDWQWGIFMFSHVLVGNRLVPITEKDDRRDW